MPDGVTTEWHGDEALGLIDEATRAGLAAVGDYYVEALRAVVSTPGPEPSAPGEPPHKQSGVLAEEIRWEPTPDGRGVEIVCDAEEGAFTEFGTSRMAPRPWFSSTLLELQGQAAGVFAAAAQGGPVPTAPASAPSAMTADAGAPPPLRAPRYQMRTRHGLQALAAARVGVQRAAGWAHETLARVGRVVTRWVKQKWR